METGEHRQLLASKCTKREALCLDCVKCVKGRAL